MSIADQASFHEPLAHLVRSLGAWSDLLRQRGLRRRREGPDDPNQDVRASDELERFREPAKAIIIWLELCGRGADAAEVDDAVTTVRQTARRYDAGELEPTLDECAYEHLSPLDLLIQAASETAAGWKTSTPTFLPTFGRVSAMREPFPEHVRRMLEACRQNSAHDVLSSRGWAELREHCGELTVDLDSLGRVSIAQRVDRDYARLHGQLREATAAASAANRLLLADAVEEIASTLAALQRFRGKFEAASACSPAGDTAALQNLGAEPAPDPEAGKPPPTLTVATLLEWTTLSNTALNKYAKLAGVQTPGRGERNFRYTWADARKILESVIANASDRRIRDKCRKALENPPEITQ